MNELDQNSGDKTMEAIHALEIKLVEGFAELKSELKRVEEKVDANGEKFDTQTATETKRLDKHSEEIDEIRDGYTMLKTKSDNNWKWILGLAMWATAIAALFAKYL